MKTNKTYIIAEVGPNHNGKIDIALEMIDKLSEIGVDAVKFQISNPENAYSLDSFKPDYQKIGDKSQSPIEMSKKYQLPFNAHKDLYKRCLEKKVDYICSAFEMDSLNFLWDNFDMPYFKIASGEIFTVDMLDFIASKEKPIILSTGMSTYDEIRVALNYLDKNKIKDITVLHCVSSYPAMAEDVNLNAMLELKRLFGYKVGLSDHSLGNEASIAAVALGATLIEKHVTLDKSWEGPDHQASSSIEEFADLVKSIRKVDLLMGIKDKVFTEKELEIKKAARKSIVTTHNLKKGDVIMREDICFKRPGIGISPIFVNELIGRVIKNDIDENRVVKEEDLI
ncbi:MAG: hypothetical protein A2033_15475 [Bacteroidetes bacterium GWA2_31_9]|nr:MAG: hypothetical protein A2033_15475 [Bacteroidetes bacterium GWA2_31_9]